MRINRNKNRKLKDKRIRQFKNKSKLKLNQLNKLKLKKINHSYYKSKIIKIKHVTQ